MADPLVPPAFRWVTDAARARALAEVAALPLPTPMGHGFTPSTDPYAAYIHGCEQMRAAILDRLAKP